MKNIYKKFLPILLGTVFLTTVSNAQFSPHHSVAELTIDGGFETYNRCSNNGGYRVGNSSDGCYDAHEGSYYLYIYNGGLGHLLLEEELNSEAIYNFSFRMRRGLNMNNGSNDPMWFQCKSSDYTGKGDFKIYLAESCNGGGNTQIIGTYKDIHQTYWKYISFTVKPNRSTYQYIIFDSDNNGLLRNAVSIDDVSFQECGAENCSRTAGKINKPSFGCCTPVISKDCILEITNNLDNVKSLTVQYNGSTKISYENPNGILRFATNGSELGLTSSGEYTLKFILSNDCDELEFTQKILYSCVNTTVNMNGKNNHNPSAQLIPRYQCADYLTITQEHLNYDNRFGARIGISTSGPITSNSTLSFVAGTSIVLSQGFNASVGFSAYLENAGNGLKHEMFDELNIFNVSKFENENDTFSLESDDSPIINVFPNPFQNFVNIKLTHQVNFVVEVFTKTGSVLLKEFNTEKIDMSKFASGIYFIKVTTDKNIYEEKIFKM